MSSIRETVHHRLIEIITNVQSESGKILILDEFTVKIVDACLSMHEILEANVFLVEMIRKGRQPYPIMDALYFLSSGPNSGQLASLISDDFKPPSKELKSGRKGAKYRTAHIFFTEDIEKEAFDELAKGYVAPYARALIETFIDFLPLEERVFQTPTLLTGGNLNNSNTVDTFMIIAQRISSVFITMNWRLDVRFEASSATAGRLAAMVQEAYNSYCSRNREFNPQKNSTLLLLDRTTDLLVPLLHEFTYQAMVMDLLEIENNRYEYKFTTALGAEQSRCCSLDESDNLWKALRHTHIADCSKEIIGSFNSFIKENKAAAKQQKSMSEGEGVTNLGELRETMNSLGEFHEMKNEYSLHLGLAQECFNQYDRRRLAEVALLEQDMVMGETVDGQPIEKTAWNRLATILDIPSLTEMDRTRVVLLYLSTQPKLSMTDQSSLFEHARLSRDSRQAIKQHLLMIQENIKTDVRKAKKSLNDGSVYDVSRYTPKIKEIAQTYSSNSEQFPSLNPSLSLDNDNTAARKAISLRMTSSKPTLSISSNTLVIFMIGGMTYSEMRSVYELSEKMQVYIGSDQILTPSKWLDFLAKK